MGAWGSGNFENDDACDWAFDLEDSGIDAIREALDAVASADDYVEAPESCSAIAAAEVVASACGRPPKDDLPDEVRAFLSGKPKIGPELVALARQALARVLADDSELRELWEESDAFDEWKKHMADLQGRLA